MKKNKELCHKITIKDVAKLAGVSTATVSRVLSGSNIVSEPLRTQVMESVDILDYQPNQLGRSLRRQATNLIGMIVSDIQNPFFTSILRGAQDGFQPKGLPILTMNSDENPDQELLHLKVLRAQGVMGLIFVPSMPDYKEVRNFFSGIAVVAVDRNPKNLKVDTIVVDNKKGSKQATQHLIALGHTRIGFIAGIKTVTTSQERLKGYLEALQESGLRKSSSLIQVGGYFQQGGYEAMVRLLNLPDPPTAVVSANNLMTLGALQAIHDRCLKIPEDIAIIGFDDMTWASSLQPPLTVVAQPTYQIGNQAAWMLLDRLNNPNLPIRRVILHTELIIRASTTQQPCGS
jgi:DNA-binding LacI/PurR family transcriptional regulator